MLYLFDLDDTLISGYMNELDRNFNRWHVLDGRARVLQRLLAEGHTLGVCTNQAGVAYGLIDQKRVWAKFAAVTKALGLPDDALHFEVCFAHPRAYDERFRDPAELWRRKPNPGMLIQQMRTFPRAAAQGVVFVGDRDDDRFAAQKAGPPVVFIPTHVFFATPSLPGVE